MFIFWSIIFFDFFMKNIPCFTFHVFLFSPFSLFSILFHVTHSVRSLTSVGMKVFFQFFIKFFLSHASFKVTPFFHGAEAPRLFSCFSHLWPIRPVKQDQGTRPNICQNIFLFGVALFE